MMSLISRLRGALVPVVSVNDENKTVAICEYLLKNGYRAIEVTYRTAAASAVIAKIKAEYPSLIVGAGTVLSVQTAKEAIASGADFIVAPGLNEKVVEYCIMQGVDTVPGVETASEIERAMSYGLNFLKFFPAEAAGGVNKLNALHAPYPDVKFMPTGGITRENSGDYLSLDYVVCCGGSFVVPKELL